MLYLPFVRRFVTFIRDFFRPDFHSVNTMQISRQAFFHNYSFLRSIQKDAAFFPVVKSYAYGHGLPEILSLLEKADCQMIAIDSYSEYQFVTRYTTKNILLLGETFPENYTLFDFARTSFCVYNL